MGTYITDLAAAARTSGLTVTEVAGWQTRGHGGFSSIKGVVLHHTAGAASGNYPSLGTVRDGRTGLAGPLANLGLARDGSVLVIAAGTAWHAGKGSGYGLPTNGANPYTIGIEAESTGKGDWTAAQIDAYPRLVAALCKHYGFGVGMVIAHKEWAPGRKVDPAGWPGDMTAFRASVTSVLNGGSVGTATATTTTATTATTSSATSGGKLTVDGRWGAATTKALQSHFGTPVDGVISHQWKSTANQNITAMQFDKTKTGSTLARAMQNTLGVTADGLFGAGSIKALQARMGTPQDGVIDAVSTCVKAMQTKLNAGTF